MSLTIISCSKKTNNTQKENVTKELDSLLLSTFKMDEPGGSVLLKKNGETVFMKSYGVEDITTGKKITENTIFNTGSISKTFVSNGILILQEQGKLSIEDSIYKYFNDFDNKEIAQKVKIKHMLSHTSGLPDLRNVRDNIEFFMTAKDTANFEPLKRTDSLNFQSGERFQYSNPSYNGLALIIEGLAEKKWQDFIKEQIFQPSGMKNSKITDGPYPETGVAHAYYKDEEGKYVEYDYGEFTTFTASGNGGIWSSVLELAKYEEAIRKNTFLSKELTEESRKPYYPKNWSDTIPPNIGYSWFTGDRRFVSDKIPSLDVNVIYHTGSQGGFKAFLISIPEKDIVFIGLFNKYRSNLNEIMNTTLQNLKKNNWLDIR